MPILWKKAELCLFSTNQIKCSNYKNCIHKPAVSCLYHFKIQGNWGWEYLQPSVNILDFKMSLNCLDKFLFLFCSVFAYLYSRLESYVFFLGQLFE